MKKNSEPKTGRESLAPAPPITDDALNEKTMLEITGNRLFALCHWCSVMMIWKQNLDIELVRRRWRTVKLPDEEGEKSGEPSKYETTQVEDEPGYVTFVLSTYTEHDYDEYPICEEEENLHTMSVVFVEELPSRPGRRPAKSNPSDNLVLRCAACDPEKRAEKAGREAQSEMFRRLRPNSLDFDDLNVRRAFVLRMEQGVRSNCSDKKQWLEWTPDQMRVVSKMNLRLAELIYAISVGDAADVSRYSSELAVFAMKTDEHFGIDSITAQKPEVEAAVVEEEEEPPSI